MKLNLIPSMEPLQQHDNLTLIRKELIVTNQVYLNENQIKINDSVIGNLGIETPNAYLKMNSDQIEFYAKSDLTIKSNEKNEKIFPPDFNRITFVPILQLTIPNGLQNVNKIRSPTDQNLEIVANNLLTFKGNNGIKLDGKQINLKSEQISLNSLNSTIKFEATNGEIYFQFDNLFSSEQTSAGSKGLDQPETLDADNYQHKLCVCGNNGLIFKLMVKDNLTKCSDVRFPVSTNPCINRQSRF